MQMRTQPGLPASRSAATRHGRGSAPDTAWINEGLACIGALALISAVMLLCGWRIEQVRLSDAAAPAVASPVQAYP
jgi:hypothetical protein